MLGPSESDGSPSRSACAPGGDRRWGISASVPSRRQQPRPREPVYLPRRATKPSLRRDRRPGADDTPPQFGDAQDQRRAVELPGQAGIVELLALGMGEEPGADQRLGHYAARRGRQASPWCGEAIRERRGAAQDRARPWPQGPTPPRRPTHPRPRRGAGRGALPRRRIGASLGRTTRRFAGHPMPSRFHRRRHRGRGAAAQRMGTRSPPRCPA
jgi:hypothetical protein